MRIESALFAILACLAPSLADAESLIDDAQPASFDRRPRVEPASPTAFEPLTLMFETIDSCENVAAFRPIDGGFRVELNGPTDQIYCDTVGTARVSIGAYPPGTYRIELGRTAEWGGTTYATLDLVVRPASTGSSRFLAGGEELSGLWFSPLDEPSTGMSFIHTGSNVAPLVYQALIGIWYRYDADGTARWYWIEATNDPVSPEPRDFSGTVFAYREVDPAAPAESRTVGATPIGIVRVSFPWTSEAGQPARVTGTLEGEAFDFRLERFRWSRAAWPQVPQE